MAEPVRWLKRVLPSDAQLEALPPAHPLAMLMGGAQGRAPVVIGFATNDDRAVDAQFAIAQGAARKILADPNPVLEESELQALLAFVHLATRPALCVRDGAVADVPVTWQRLADASRDVTRVLSGVGRIDARGGVHTGTGWYVARNLLLTNKHVVAQLCGLDLRYERRWRAALASAIVERNQIWRRQASEWPTWSATDDGVGAADGPVITKIRAVHPELDMALLEVDNIDTLEPLSISASAPKSPADHPVYVVGYPAVVARPDLHPVLAKLLFAGADERGRKRVSPGQLLALVEPHEASHDASTLGGSSGSPVIDLDTHRVVGLHHSGHYGTANYAVPLWLVKDDPFFTNNGVVAADRTSVVVTANIGAPDTRGGVMETDQFHVLLIGIDAYAGRNALYGCVSDIDKIEKLLVGPKIEIDPARITRLTSPRTPNGDTPATLANIRAAFKELAAKATTGDRVFIYYSGHGAREPIVTAQGIVHREALVPVDADADRLLYDYELNGLLAAIVAKTSSVTFILDCCHSAGATRGPEGDMLARAYRAPDGVVFTEANAAPAGPTERGGALARGVEQCHVVSACLDHESAVESTSGGERNGLLTRALVDALDQVDVPLRSVSWGQVWSSVRDRVVRENAAQHVWMAGNAARILLAGPPVEGDAGFEIKRGEGDAYVVGGGALGGIGVGTEIAVYGEEPRFWKPIGSPEDRPVGTLVVTDASRATSRAKAKAPFDLPKAPRGRLVSKGALNRVRCFVDDPAAAAAARTSPVLEVVETRNAADVRVERRGGGWALADDIHDVTAALLPLFEFYGDGEVVRDVLEHYTRYRLPIQLANEAKDLSNQLTLTLRACNETLPTSQAQAAELPEAPLVNDREYQLRIGNGVVFHVRNTSAETLRVTLVNCGSSGRVQLFGDQAIAKNGAYLFWLPSGIGKPFFPSTPGTDRVIAIGRTSLGSTLDFLRADRKFKEVVPSTRGGTRGADEPVDRDFDDAERAVVAAVTEMWTASQIIVRTRA